MKYTITEINGKDKTGLVGHSVITPLNRLAEFVSYDEARALVEASLKDGDTVLEVYQSSGREASYTAEEFKLEQEQIRLKYGA